LFDASQYTNVDPLYLEYVTPTGRFARIKKITIGDALEFNSSVNGRSFILWYFAKHLEVDGVLVGLMDLYDLDATEFAPVLRDAFRQCRTIFSI
jgi:hypothetical protein